MKKLLAITLASLLALTLFACGNPAQPEATTPPADEEYIPLQIGDTLTFGMYGGQPIVWEATVVDLQTGRAQLVTAEEFAVPGNTSAYEWLTGEFCNIAFTREQYAKITMAQPYEVIFAEYGVCPVIWIGIDNDRRPIL